MSKSRSFLVAACVFFVFHSCELNQDPIVVADELEIDFSEAEQLVEEFYQTEVASHTDQNARRGAIRFDKSITVLKYKKGRNGEPGTLLFNTNKDRIRGYQPVTEETITAIITPGEYVFWFAGGGLDHIEGIDFDDESEQELDDLPEDYQKSRIWYIKVPDDIDETTLKYDILYQIRGASDIIRLDPKLKVNN